MAKKKSKTAKSASATKTPKSSAAKPSTRSPSKKAPKSHDHGHDHHGESAEEIELDDTERNAIDHIIECDEARDALEQEVNAVVAQAVRKICKVHGNSLTAAQAQNVAMVLFGD